MALQPPTTNPQKTERTENSDRTRTTKGQIKNRSSSRMIKKEETNHDGKKDDVELSEPGSVADAGGGGDNDGTSKSDINFYAMFDPPTFTKRRRTDDRLSQEIRQSTIQKGHLSTKHCHGSALLHRGHTQIVGGVTFMIGQPSPSSMDEGELEVIFTMGVTCRTNQQQQQSAADRCLRVEEFVKKTLLDSQYVDLRQLCLLKGQAAFRLTLELLCLNDDGNLLDSSLECAIASLQNTTLPSVQFNEHDGMFVENIVLNDNDDTSKNQRKQLSLDSSREPTSLTFGIFASANDDNDELVIYADPCASEEQWQEGSLTVSIDRDGRLVNLTTCGKHMISQDILKACIHLAETKTKSNQSS